MPYLGQVPQEPLLTVTEVAALLHRNVRTVRRWAAAGRLPVAQQLPGKTGALLFDPEDVKRVIVEAAA